MTAAILASIAILAFLAIILHAIVRWCFRLWDEAQDAADQGNYDDHLTTEPRPEWSWSGKVGE